LGRRSPTRCGGQRILLCRTNEHVGSVLVKILKNLF
jgi:hypothetical protein